MNALEIGMRLTAGAVLILLNAFFVAIEFGLTRARQYPESDFDTPGLRRAWEMTDDLEFYLTTCQIWISGTSIALGIIAEPGLAALIEPVFENSRLASIGAGSLLAFGLINLVHLTHGEQTPTYLGVERSKQVCRYGARPLYWFAKAIAPLIKFGDWVAKGTLGLFGVEMTQSWTETETDVIESRAELRNRLGSVLEEGDLPPERREEVMNALRIGEKPIREVMVPAEKIVALSTAADTEENLRRMAERPQTRYPLVGDSLTEFRGIVYTPVLLEHREDLASGEIDFAELAAPPITLGPETGVSDAIDRFQRENQELALVVENSEERSSSSNRTQSDDSEERSSSSNRTQSDDSEGQRPSRGRPQSDDEVIGLVTVTDLLEAVMGDVEDPLDQGVVDTGEVDDV
ncbi:CNNM domain-containing protein [Haloterrigena alkaliphila]|uniref:HlyC/CorC family transporter n=1 Tax=Haloterrigena alkaliphila TaxID=2816475 RepID=A0A8A2VEJ3_9EURY|nr:hemolysin family protein [Haloterrigena alkaliphila]QSW98834.1 hemolysin family protein [Haloterrigena alkaliphila]